MNLSSPSLLGSQLPYEVLNIIFDYLSQIKDERHKKVLNSRGDVAFKINTFFSGFSFLSDLYLFKARYPAKPVMMRLYSWPISGQDPITEVEARGVSRKMEGNILSKCFSFEDATTHRMSYIYTEFVENTSLFKHGTAHLENNRAYRVMELFEGGGNVLIVSVNFTHLDWDPAELEAADAIADLLDL